MDENQENQPKDDLHETELLHQRQQKLIKILEEIKLINEKLEEGYPPDEGSIMRTKLSQFNSDLARVNTLTAEAKVIYQLARAYWSEQLDAKIQATRFREILEGRTSFEETVFFQAQRTARTLEVMIDSIRSQLAFLKEEMRQSGY